MKLVRLSTEDNLSLLLLVNYLGWLNLEMGKLFNVNNLSDQHSFLCIMIYLQAGDDSYESIHYLQFPYSSVTEL